MKRNDEITMAEFYNEKGEFFGRTLGAGWTPPSRVAMVDGELTIQSTNQYRTGTNSGPLIRAPHGLLDSFVDLGSASKERTTLGFLVAKCPSDEKHELLAVTIDDRQVVFGEFAPVLLERTLELLPFPFCLIPIHGDYPFLRDEFRFDVSLLPASKVPVHMTCQAKSDTCPAVLRPNHGQAIAAISFSVNERKRVNMEGLRAWSASSV
jgi:hypothetical protein